MATMKFNNRGMIRISTPAASAMIGCKLEMVIVIECLPGSRSDDLPALNLSINAIQKSRYQTRYLPFRLTRTVAPTGTRS